MTIRVAEDIRRTVQHYMRVMGEMPTGSQLANYKKALAFIDAWKKKRKRNPSRKLTAEQVTLAMLQEFADVHSSGVTEMTGKGRRDAGREGEFIGRFGGIKKSYPGISGLKQGPKAIAAAIRRGRGKVFDQVKSSVYAAMLKKGFLPARKHSPGRPTISAHTGLRRCARCKTVHTKGQHRFHGPGSFERTHYPDLSAMWGLNPPLKKKPVVIYGRVLRIEAMKTQKHICDADCKRCGHCYFHDFKSGAVMYGLSNGDILISKGSR